MSSSCVCEFQAFYDNDNLFVIKELVVLDVSKKTYIHLHFLPPFDRFELNSVKLRTTRWLEKHFHGLLWEDGEAEYSLDTVRSLLAPFTCVYTKGAQKRDFLKSILDFSDELRVIDLDEFKSLIPKLKSYKGKGGITCPITSGFHSGTKMRCALKKAAHLADWLSRPSADYRREHDRLFSLINLPDRLLHCHSRNNFVKLTESGFYYDRTSDSVRCVWCGMRFIEDDLDELLLEEHRRRSPNCDSLVSYVNNIPLALDHTVPRKVVGS